MRERRHVFSICSPTVGISAIMTRRREFAKLQQAGVEYTSTTGKCRLWGSRQIDISKDEINSVVLYIAYADCRLKVLW